MSGSTLSVTSESWPLAQPFVIARGTKTAADVVVAEIARGGFRGRGEGVPYARYGETVEGVLGEIEGLRSDLEGGLDRAGLIRALPHGAARNALDCALWDLEAKSSGRRAWELAGIAAPQPVVTAETITIGTPGDMAAKARALAAGSPSGRPLLKVKLGANGVEHRMTAVRAAAPQARLVVDPNEGWDLPLLERMAPFLRDLGVELIEQPLTANADDGLADFVSPVPLCADESCHVAADLDRLVGRYEVVNIKLDKSGGLTEALDLLAAARQRGFGIMVGCMVATSLAMAPALLLAGGALVVDLDGPLLLTRDRQPGLDFSDGLIHPPEAAVWG